MTISGLFVGECTVDIEYLVEQPPERNDKTRSTRFDVAAGGPATNAAVVFAHLGGRATLATVIGDHPFTDFMAKEPARWGVEVRDLAPRSTQMPPVSSIWIAADNGDRTIVTAPKRSFPVEPERLSEDHVRASRVVLLDGFYLEAAIKAAKLAHAAGIPVVLDSGHWKDGLEEALPYLSHAIVSESLKSPDGRPVAEYLRSAGVAHVAVTRGERPITAYDDTGAAEIPSQSVQAVDTLAAGDFFHGAFCYYLAGGAPWCEALAAAGKVVARRVQTFGTRAWLNGAKSNF